VFILLWVLQFCLQLKYFLQIFVYILCVLCTHVYVVQRAFKVLMCSALSHAIVLVLNYSDDVHQKVDMDMCHYRVLSVVSLDCRMHLLC